MPRLHRNIQDDQYYHLVNRGVGRRTTFRDEFDYAYFMKLLSRECEKHSVPVIAYSLMPNHFHVLIKKEETSQVSRWIKTLQGVYAQYFNRKNDRSGHLWQDRFFSSRVRDGFHLARTLMYVEQNPVNANLVKSAEDWKWSSAFLRANSFMPRFLIEPSWWNTKKRDEWWSKNILTKEELEFVRNLLRKENED